MAQHLPEGYRINPEDPRAPSEDQWARMSPAERARVVDALPSSLPAPERAGEERRAYRPILPQAGRYTSEVLGLDLMLEDTRLRFCHGAEPVPEADELIAKLGTALDQAERRAQEQAERIASLEGENAALRAEMARLRGGK